MKYKRDFLYHKKIIGGSIIGNVWDAAKNIISRGTKMAIDKGKELFRIGASKALEAGKDISKDLASKATDFAKDKVSDFTRRGAETLIGKARGGVKQVSNKLSPQARETIQKLTTDPQIRKVFTDKAKQALARAPINDNSRAIISNLIAGSGVKRLK